MNRNRKSELSRPPGWFAATICLAVAAVVGCRGPSVLKDPLVLKRAIPPESAETMVLTSGGQWEKAMPPEPGTPDGDYRIADSLFQSEDYAKAAKGFEEVADKHESNAIVHERALFMKAESEFLQGKYPKARDSYEELLKIYPGSPHLAAAQKRLYKIGDEWLEDARRDVRNGRPSSFPRRFVNLDPEHKPFFDIDGHAVHVLDHIPEKDPNSPLADDALMKTAGYEYSVGDYREAEKKYDTLIHNYPRSEFQPQAHLMSAEAKMQSYKGSAFDQRKLTEADSTLRAALVQFPTELEPERQRVITRLDEIKQQEAKSQFEIGEYYRRTGHPKSALLYYQYVVKQFPGTKWAERAAERLAADQPKLDDAQGNAPPSTADVSKQAKR